MSQPTHMQKLYSVFQDFVSFGKGHEDYSMRMDSRTLQKFCKDTGLVGKGGCTRTDIDLIFTKYKAHGQKSLSFNEFQSVVSEIARRRRWDMSRMMEQILKSEGPQLHAAVTRTEKTRFHDDPTMYTGVYKHPGGPKTVDVNERITLSSLTDRSPSDVRGRKFEAPKYHTRAGDPRAQARAQRAAAEEWYEVPNTSGQGPSFYYVNRRTNETSWEKPAGEIKVKSRRLSDHGRNLFSGAHSGGSGGGRQAGGIARAQQLAAQKVAAQNRNARRSGGGGGGGGSIFDRLTDTSLYTGAHRNRFDAQGRGLGLAGRDPVAKGRGCVPSSRGLGGKGAYVGNTNTNTDEVFHDSSQFLMRR